MSVLHKHFTVGPDSRACGSYPGMNGRVYSLSHTWLHLIFKRRHCTGQGSYIRCPINLEGRVIRWRAETKEFYLCNRFHLLSQSELSIQGSSHIWRIGSSFCARAGRDRCIRTFKRLVSFGLINAASGWGESAHEQVPHAALWLGWKARPGPPPCPYSKHP